MRYLFVLLMLSSCATAPQSDPKWDEFERHMARVSARQKAGQITQREAAVSALEKLRALNMNDPYLEEAWAYRVMLAGKVERTEITDDEAAYLDTQKVNELTDRALAAERARYPRVPTRREVTQCRPDGYGGVRCTTR
jgi:hypothetical protein